MTDEQFEALIKMIKIISSDTMRHIGKSAWQQDAIEETRKLLVNPANSLISNGPQ